MLIKKLFLLLTFAVGLYLLIIHFNLINSTQEISKLFGYRIFTKIKKELELCPWVPEGLDSNVNVSHVLSSPNSFEATFGGEYIPPDCIARESVAIIVPYRNREYHKALFLKHMHRFLQRQQIHYKIYFVEMAWPTTFNRGLLLNIGYSIAQTRNFTCYIFHDVDLLPSNEKNMYLCNDSIIHFSTNNSKINYTNTYFHQDYLGGVLGIAGHLYRQINGFSNSYFGWGGEDDDILARIRNANLTIAFPPKDIGSYKAQPHRRDVGNELNPLRRELLKTLEKIKPSKDGINSLNYRVLLQQTLETYEWILVNVNQSDYTMYVDKEQIRRKKKQNRQPRKLEKRLKRLKRQ